MRFSANVRSDALNQASHVKSPVAGDDTSVGMLSVVCALFALGVNVSTVSADAANAAQQTAKNMQLTRFIVPPCLLAMWIIQNSRIYSYPNLWGWPPRATETKHSCFSF